MTRLFVVLLAMCMCMCIGLSNVAQAGEESTEYFVALGKLDPAKMMDPANAAALGEHIVYLGQLYDAGSLVMAGPLGNHDSGLILLRAGSLEEAQALLMADPAIGAGIIAAEWVKPWYAFFSRPDSRTLTLEQFQAMMAAEKPIDADASGSMEHSEGSMEMTIGDVGFIAIPATDAAVSGAFYATHFGWEIMPMDFGGMPMTFWTAPGGQMGEFSTMSGAAAPQTGVTFYINTESVNAKLAELTAAGSTIVMPPMALPEGAGHIALFTDPAGNVVGIWSAAP